MLWNEGTIIIVIWGFCFVSVGNTGGYLDDWIPCTVLLSHVHRVESFLQEWEAGSAPASLYSKLWFTAPSVGVFNWQNYLFIFFLQGIHHWLYISVVGFGIGLKLLWCIIYYSTTFKRYNRHPEIHNSGRLQIDSLHTQLVTWSIILT